MRNKILSYIDSNLEDLISILKRTIEINTENDGKHADETPLADYLKREYGLLGVKADTYCPSGFEDVVSDRQYLKGRNLEGRKNVTAVLKGTDSHKSMMIAGHLDTVPAGDVSAWNHDPFSPVIIDGRIYGRGANDDKYALACCLFIAKMFKSLGIKTKNDIYLTGYVDEEFGGGNGALAACINYPCDFYLNLDGDCFDIWDTATGGARIAIHIKHKNPVSSCGDIIEGFNIIKKHLDAFGAQKRSELEANSLYAGSQTSKDALRYMACACGTNTSDKNRGFLDFAFYTDQSIQTVNNQLAKLFEDIARDLSQLNIEIENVEYKSRFFEYSRCEADAEIERLKTAAEKASGRKIQTEASPLSDLNIFMAASGGKAAGFGIGVPFDLPGGAHQTDESLSIDDLAEITKILAFFILDWDEN